MEKVVNLFADIERILVENNVPTKNIDWLLSHCRIMVKFKEEKDWKYSFSVQTRIEGYLECLSSFDILSFDARSAIEDILYTIR